MPSCPAGHDSISADFCDICGLAMTAAPTPQAPTVVPEPQTPDETCPECGEPRTGRFCEGCSYDFIAGKAPAGTRSTPVVVTGPATHGSWAAVVSADRAHFDAVQAQEGPDAADIAFPAYCPDRRFALTGTQIRIGRRSRSRGLEPEIDLTGPPADPGVSHLHAVLLAQAGGGWALVDPGSTNGTTINDDLDPIKTDTPVPLKDGDKIHVGAWTTITVHAP